MIDPNYRIDNRWPTFIPPRSAISQLVQMPLYRITPEAVVAAYMKDERNDRKAG